MVWLDCKRCMFTVNWTVSCPRWVAEEATCPMCGANMTYRFPAEDRYCDPLCKERGKCPYYTGGR